MLALIEKEFRFEAAHSLPNHDGKCRGLHGHSYRVVVQVGGVISHAFGESDEGMIVDFKWLTAAWKERCEPLLDHRFLNDSLGLSGPTTAENIADWILVTLSEPVARAPHSGEVGLLVTEVRLWETATGCVVVRR